MSRLPPHNPYTGEGRMSARTKHANQVNPCARVLADMAKLCFLINEETGFDAFFNWSGHVNEVDIWIAPKGTNRDHAVLVFDEYMNIPKTTGMYTDDWRTDTYPKVKKFADELRRFYESRSAEAA